MKPNDKTRLPLFMLVKEIYPVPTREVVSQTGPGLNALRPKFFLPLPFLVREKYRFSLSIA